MPSNRVLSIPGMFNFQTSESMWSIKQQRYLIRVANTIANGRYSRPFRRHSRVQIVLCVRPNSLTTHPHINFLMSGLEILSAPPDLKTLYKYITRPSIYQNHFLERGNTDHRYHLTFQNKWPYSSGRSVNSVQVSTRGLIQSQLVISSSILELHGCSETLSWVWQDLLAVQSAWDQQHACTGSPVPYIAIYG